MRTVSHRNRGSVAHCPDCRRGEVVPRETFCDWWLEHFSPEECAVMARAIWGDQGSAVGGGRYAHLVVVGRKKLRQGAVPSGPPFARPAPSARSSSLVGSFL